MRRVGMASFIIKGWFQKEDQTPRDTMYWFKYYKTRNMIRNAYRSVYREIRVALSLISQQRVQCKVAHETPGNLTREPVITLVVS